MQRKKKREKLQTENKFKTYFDKIIDHFRFINNVFLGTN